MVERVDLEERVKDGMRRLHLDEPHVWQDDHRLKRWLLKLSFNSACIHHARDLFALEEMRPYILGAANTLWSARWVKPFSGTPPACDRAVPAGWSLSNSMRSCSSAAQPMPTELGTLDALPLATAVLWREMWRVDLVMATHDTALGLAARAHGFPVVVIPR
jgi:hypothetical protein